MALFDFNALPGLGTARETAERTFLWGKHEQAIFRSIVLDASSQDVNNATSVYELRPGLCLAQLSTNKWKPYVGTNSDGTELVQGVLAFSAKMLDLSGSTSDKLGVAVVAGPVKGSQLIKNVSGSPTIDPQARSQMYGAFRFDDDLVGNKYPWRHTIAKTTSYTVTLSDNMTCFTTAGAAGSVTFTLPALLDSNSAAQAKGVKYRFYNSVAQTMTVVRAGSDSVIAYNNASATQIAFSTGGSQIGCGVDVEVNDAGTAWLFIPFGTTNFTVS